MTDAVVDPAPAADPAPAPAPAAEWHGLTDPDGLAYVANKGWKGPTDVLNSYRNLEKISGRDPNLLMPVPRADDPEGFRQAMVKLGLPDSPDKYEFAKADGLPVDENYQSWAKQTFHKLGLPAQTVKALTAEHNNFVKGILDQQKQDYELKVQADRTALLKEWGGGHERMMSAAQHAAKALGFDEATLNAIEQSKGYAGTWKMMAALGAKLGEDSFVSSAGNGSGQRFEGTMTPAEAKASFDQLKLDPQFMAALRDKSHPGHKGAFEKQTRLFQIMYPQ